MIVYYPAGCLRCSVGKLILLNPFAGALEEWHCIAILIYPKDRPVGSFGRQDAEGEVAHFYMVKDRLVVSVRNSDSTNAAVTDEEGENKG